MRPESKLAGVKIDQISITHELTFEKATTLFVLNEVPFTPAKLVVYPPWAQR